MPQQGARLLSLHDITGVQGPYFVNILILARGGHAASVSDAPTLGGCQPAYNIREEKRLAPFFCSFCFCCLLPL